MRINIGVREFQVGDWVYLMSQPYTKKIVAGRTNNKLSTRYYGPHQIIQRIGSMAYKMELPAMVIIHRILHVSLLKKKIGEK